MKYLFLALLPFYSYTMQSQFPRETGLRSTINKPEIDHIIYAIQRNDIDAVKEFISKRIDLNIGYTQRISSVDTYRRLHTALMYAAEWGHYKITELLLKAGAHPNLQNMQRHTALTLCNQHTNIMELLMQHKANPNIPVFQGFTALMYALLCRNLVHTKLLLQHGADTRQINDHGFSAYDYAHEAGQNFVDTLDFYEKLENLKAATNPTLSIYASRINFSDII